jgi:UDP-glucose 4-epimerase
VGATVDDIIRLMVVRAREKELALRVNVREMPIRAGDPPELVADNGFLRTWYDREFKTVNQAVREIAAITRRS